MFGLQTILNKVAGYVYKPQLVHANFKEACDHEIISFKGDSAYSIHLSGFQTHYQVSRLPSAETVVFSQEEETETFHFNTLPSQALPDTSLL